MKSIKSNQKRVDKAGTAELIPGFAEHFDLFLAQTEEIRLDLNERYKVPLDQIYLAPPMIPVRDESFAKPPQSLSRKLKIGYAGKIAPEWGVRELIVISEQAQKENSMLKFILLVTKYIGIPPLIQHFTKI